MCFRSDRDFTKSFYREFGPNWNFGCRSIWKSDTREEEGFKWIWPTFCHEGREEVTRHRLLQCDLHHRGKGSFGPCFGASVYHDTVLVLPNRGNFQFFEAASYFQRVINSEIYHQYENVMFRCICKIWKMCYELHHVCLAVHLSVCLSVWNNSATTGRIFIKFECIKFNENLSKICQNNLSFTKVW